MKPHKQSQDTGVVSMRIVLLIAAIAFLPILAFATAPGWWSTRGVVRTNVQPNDYGPANEGQLKNIAKAAAAELDAQLPGGAGTAVHTLIDQWTTPQAGRNDF